MFFAPSETDGFHLVHTAKQYLEVVSNPNRVNLDNILPEWDAESMSVDVTTVCSRSNRRVLKISKSTS